MLKKVANCRPSYLNYYTTKKIRKKKCLIDTTFIDFINSKNFINIDFIGSRNFINIDFTNSKNFINIDFISFKNFIDFISFKSFVDFA